MKEMFMYCTNCGQHLSNAARFCSQCGQGTGYTGAAERTGYYSPRRLTRLSYDKNIAGVCSGLARFTDSDVTLIRLIVVAVTIFSGIIPGMIAYGIAWLVMPVDQGVFRPAPVAPATPPPAHDEPAAATN